MPAWTPSTNEMALRVGGGGVARFRGSRSDFDPHAGDAVARDGVKYTSLHRLRHGASAQEHQGAKKDAHGR